jgi:hypothetical protein
MDKRLYDRFLMFDLVVCFVSTSQQVKLMAVHALLNTCCWSFRSFRCTAGVNIGLKICCHPVRLSFMGETEFMVA